MYLAYIVTLFILCLILFLVLAEEARHRNSITHGIANKYWMLRERRHFVRFDSDLKIRYDLINSKQTQDADTNNISMAGLCISTYEKLRQKDVMELAVDVPGFSKPVRLTGRVIWVKELHSHDNEGRRIFYTGIKFNKISPDSKAILLTHLNKLKRPSY